MLTKKVVLLCAILLCKKLYNRGLGHTCSDSLRQSIDHTVASHLLTLGQLLYDVCVCECWIVIKWKTYKNYQTYPCNTEQYFSLCHNSKTNLNQKYSINIKINCLLFQADKQSCWKSDCGTALTARLLTKISDMPEIQIINR